MTYRDPKTGRWAVPHPFGDHGGGLSQPLKAEELTRVFVYGTLKRGYGNNALLTNSAFVGEAVTVPRFRMLDAGFPVLIEDADGRQVAGELYDVDAATLRCLDQLEGEGRMYHRKIIDVTMNSGGPVEASVYVGADTWKQRRMNDGTDAWTNPDGELEWDWQSYQNIVLRRGEQVDG